MPKSKKEEGFTLSELQIIRESLSGEIDLLDEELDDKRNQTDISIDRTKQLHKHELLMRALTKVNSQIRRQTHI